MLTSVWEGNDKELLYELMALHCRHDSTMVVDCTWGNGGMWDPKDDCRVVGSDLDPERAKDILADFQYLPFRDDSVDVLIFDPPHIADAGKPRPKFMSSTYGIVWGASSIAVLFPRFTWEAKRILKPDGIVIAKLSDQIQGGVHHWQTFDYVQQIQLVGLTPCDIVVKIRPRAIPNSQKSQKHSRQRHSYFIVARKGRC